MIKGIDKAMIGLGPGTDIGKSSSRAPVAPMHGIFIKRIDEELIGIGTCSSRSLEATRHGTNMVIKRLDKEVIGLGLGTHIWKSSSVVLEAPRHGINIFIKGINKELIGIGTSSSGALEATRYGINICIKSLIGK